MGPIFFQVLNPGTKNLMKWGGFPRDEHCWVHCLYLWETVVVRPVVAGHGYHGMTFVDKYILSHKTWCPSNKSMSLWTVCGVITVQVIIMQQTVSYCAILVFDQYEGHSTIWFNMLGNHHTHQQCLQWNNLLSVIIFIVLVLVWEYVQSM